MHSAPAHGFEDYEMFQKVGLSTAELRSPIDDSGKFTEELLEWCSNPLARSLVGQSVQGEGTSSMIDLYTAEGLLLATEKIRHRYPYDWKSKKPIITRSAEPAALDRQLIMTRGMRQWFADVDAVKSTALQAIKNVDYYPKGGAPRR